MEGKKRGRKPGFITGNEDRDQKILKEFDPKEHGVVTRIAHDYGLTKERIRQILQRHGVQVTHGFTKEEEDRIVREYSEGVPSYKIARKLQSATHRICDVLRSRGIKIRSLKEWGAIRPHPKNTDIAKLYHEGMSVEQIGYKIKMYPSTVRKRLAEMKIPVKAKIGSRSQRPDLDDTEIIRLYQKENATYRQLAEKFNCSWRSIYNRLVKHGVVGQRPPRHAKSIPF